MPEPKPTSCLPHVRSALDVLGLGEHADWEDIRTRYSSAVKECHPDSASDSGDRDVLERTIAAYRVLAPIYRSAAPRRRPNAPDRIGGRASRSARHKTRSAYHENSQHPNGTSTHREADRPDERFSRIAALGEQALFGVGIRERCFACDRLGSSNRRSAGSYLRAALYDENERVVCAAANAIGNLGVLSAWRDLECVFEGGSPAIKCAIIEAAHNIGPFPCFRDLCLEAMATENPGCRSSAVRLFGKIDRNDAGYAVGRKHGGRQ